MKWFLSITSLIGFFALAIGSMNDSQASFLFLLPLIYCVFSMLLQLPGKAQKNACTITLYIVWITQWIRCVFMPVAGYFSGVYAGTDLTESVLLLAYEQVIVWLVCLLLTYKESGRVLHKPLNREPTSDFPNTLTFSGTYLLYGVFIAFAAVLYWFFGRNQDLFSFIFLDTEERVGDITDSGSVMIREIILMGLNVLTLCVIHFCYTRYASTEERRYVTAAIMVAVLMLCIIVGERRTSQVYKLFAYSWILIALFPRHRKSILKWLIITAVFVLAMMSIYKFFYAFLYDSYLEAIQHSSMDLAETVRMFDSYFYGINTLDRNFVFINAQSVPFTQLFKDVLVNIFGVHYLMGSTATTTELYNLYLYGGEQATGYLFSAVGYGCLFFGKLLAPLLTALNVAVAAFLEKTLRRVTSLEFSYAFALVYMRYAFGIFCSFPSLLNSASRTLVLYAVVVGLSGILRKRVGTKLRTTSFGSKKNV